MIIIGQPEIIQNQSKSRLQAELNIDGKINSVWFEVDKKHEDYLCYERSDAFVIGVLNYAMRNHHDIICDAPISEELFYNLETYLIKALAKYNKHFHHTKIDAPIASDSLANAGAVGTGISCGVDSLHALANETRLRFKNHNITHLTFNNVGSHGFGRSAEMLYNERLTRPKRFAEEYGFVFIASNSNIMDVIEQNHFFTHTYSSMFAVYCLQKLFSIYYYASAGYRYDEFTFIDNKRRSPGSYEFLLLPLLSSKSLRIYSEGEGLSRLEKLKSVIKYDPSYKYLDVCLKESLNCGKCEKCVRTILGIDALGMLNNYEAVFNLDYYKSNKAWYLQQMLYQIKNKKHDYFEIYTFFKNDITLIMKFNAEVYVMKNKIKKHLPQKIKKQLKILCRI